MQLNGGIPLNIFYWNSNKRAIGLVRCIWEKNAVQQKLSHTIQERIKDVELSIGWKDGNGQLGQPWQEFSILWSNLTRDEKGMLERAT